MYKLVPYEAKHIWSLLEEPINLFCKDLFLSGLAVSLEGSDAMTIFRGDQVLVCGGINPYWAGRGQIWTMFSLESKKYFLPVFRLIKKWLKEMLQTKYARIEVSVDYGFEQGCRRAEMLGFELEVKRAKQYLPGGRDCTLYSMVRD